MNLKLILMLSMLGLGMGIATVTFLPGKIEMFVWPAIMLFSGWMIAKKAGSKYFVHGLALGLVNCFFVTSIHMYFPAELLALNPELKPYMDAPLIPNHPRWTMVVMGLTIGLLSGVVMGLLAVLFSRLSRK